MNNTETNIPSENRLVVLTDVMDSSLSNEREYLNEFSKKGIHTTIIGISENFKS